MASTTLSVLTPTLAGATITAKSAVASGQTLTIQATTAQGALDLASLHVRVENQSTTAAVTLSLGAGDNFSEVNLGAASISIATATTVMIGGQFFESARFLTDDDVIIFTQAGAGPTSWEAYQTPKATE